MRHEPPFLLMIASRLGIARQSVAQKTMPALRRVPCILAHYRDTRKLLRGSISQQSRRGLDWLNFFLADVQTGFGAFVAFYLAELGWPKAQVGLALAAGTIAALIAQIPGGALVDAAPWKRGLAGIGICMIGASALIFAVAPAYVLVFVAQILNGVSGAIVTPAIAAISLGLVGRSAMSTRTGRNTRFNALGNVLTAGAMGLAGQYVAKSAIFFGAAVLCVPALIALIRIRGDEIDYARARNAGIGKQAGNIHRIFDIGKNAKLYIFAACLFMFQFADASMLPVIGQEVARNQSGPSAVLMAGLIATPQVITALISPWVGYHSERFGRKPLLLVGFGVEILRALLFACFSSYWILVAAQLLSGVSAAAVTVLTILVITDLTTGTGRFNLVRGFIGTVIAIAASISTGITGFIFQDLGNWQGFLILAGFAAAAAALLWLAMPETRPTKYLD
jgi:MFS family permease